MLHKPESRHWSALLETQLIFPESVLKQILCIPKLSGCHDDQRQLILLMLFITAVYCKKDEHINIYVLAVRYLLGNSCSLKAI